MRLQAVLSPNGTFYLLGIEDNKPKELQEIMEKDGFKSEFVRKKKARNERLFILKFWR